MVDPALFPLFLVAAAVLVLVPGPDIAFTLATTANRGARAGFAAMGGIMAGGAIWILSAAAGLTAVLAASEHALTVIRYAGGAYLVWLAIETIRHIDVAPEAAAASSEWRAFRRGLLTNLTNPKAGVFVIAFLPQFVNPDIGPVWLQFLTLGAVIMAMAVVVLSGVVLGAGALRQRLIRSALWRRTLNGMAAAIFGGLGLRLLFIR